MTIWTLEFVKAAAAPLFDKFGSWNGEIWGAKKRAPRLWGGKQVRENVGVFASGGQICELCAAQFCDTKPPRRKRSNVARVNHAGSKYTCFIGKFARALNSALEAGKPVPPYLSVS